MIHLRVPYKLSIRLKQRMWTGYYIPSAYGPNPLFMVLQLAEILIHNPILWQFQMSKSDKNESSPRLLAFPYMS